MSDKNPITTDVFADDILLRPIFEKDKNYTRVVMIFAVLLFIAGVIYIRQVWLGLGVTGLNQPVTWGFYIVNFIFFIGISHAGTLISAILRLSKAEWRRPITRMAEVITAIVLAIGGLHPILDLGRPDRVLNVFSVGRLQSPLLWDVVSISAYFTASTVYLYIPLIPDIALLRDRGAKPQWLYTFLSWGWTGSPQQHKVLDRAINILMVMVIPIAISVHTVISYIFSMTLQPGWHSTIFGPYFVCGAIFSGIAALLIVMLAFRKLFHLEEYLREIHFRYLGNLLLVMSLLWFYFTFSEYLTGYFGHEPFEMTIFWYKFSGPYAPYFWAMIIGNFFVPLFFLVFKKRYVLRNVFIASCTVIVGMWLERLIIVVPTLANTHLHTPIGIYVPSLTEWSLFLGGISTFVLGFALFAKFFPVVSVWEVREGREQSVKEVSKRLREYMPGKDIILTEKT